MKTLLKALHHLLCYFTEIDKDCRYKNSTDGDGQIPLGILERMKYLKIELGYYLSGDIEGLKQTIKEKFPDFKTQVGKKIEAIRFVREETAGKDILKALALMGYDNYFNEQKKKDILCLAAAKRFIESII